jgi:hypothetical protein
MKIGQVLRAEYSAAEAPMPERLTKLLMRLQLSERSAPRVSSAFAPTCPRCNITMVQVVHAAGLGGHPSLNGFACQQCRYIYCGRLNRESTRAVAHHSPRVSQLFFDGEIP